MVAFPVIIQESAIRRDGEIRGRGKGNGGREGMQRRTYKIVAS